MCLQQIEKRHYQDVRICREADVGSDHYLMTAVLKLKLKRPQKLAKKQPFAVDQLKDSVVLKKS